MFRSVRGLRIAGAALLASAGLAVASCSGGSVATTPVATPAPTSAPVVQSVPAAGGSLTLASSTAQVASVTFAAGAPAGVQLTAQGSATAPSGAPAISSLARSTQAKAAPQAITGAVPFYYVTFSVSANLATTFLSSESVSLLPADPLTASYGVAFDDITTAPGTELGATGPGTIAGGIVTILNGTSANSPTLVPGHTYLMQFFYVLGSATSSPSASPTATPSAGATATASAGPTTSPTASPTASPAPTASPSAVASATALPAYTFSGNSDTDSPTSCNTSSCLQLYLSPGTMIQFPAASAATTLVATFASGPSQITGTPTFPYYTGAGTVFQYLQLSATPAVTFATTPSITVNGATGSTCSFYGYTTNSGVTYAWTLIAGPATISSGSVTIPAVSSLGTIDVSPAPFYGAIVCS